MLNNNKLHQCIWECMTYYNQETNPLFASCQTVRAIQATILNEIFPKAENTNANFLIRNPYARYNRKCENCMPILERISLIEKTFDDYEIHYDSAEFNQLKLVLDPEKNPIVKIVNSEMKKRLKIIIAETVIEVIRTMY